MEMEIPVPRKENLTECIIFNIGQVKSAIRKDTAHRADRQTQQQPTSSWTGAAVSCHLFFLGGLANQFGIKMKNTNKPLNNLWNRDLLCLLNKNKVASVEDAVEIIKPHLKPILTLTELEVLRKSILNIRGRFLARLRASSYDKQNFIKKYAEGLLSNLVRLPAFLHLDYEEGLDLESEAGPAAKCGNCQKLIANKHVSPTRQSKERDRQKNAFQVVFEAFLRLNNVQDPFDLPEICSNCYALLKTLHTTFVQFLNSTATSSPIRVLVGSTSVWKDLTNVTNPIPTRDVKRKSLKAIEAGPIKLLKPGQPMHTGIVNEVEESPEVNVYELNEPFEDDFTPVVIQDSVRSVRPSPSAQPKKRIQTLKPFHEMSSRTKRRRKQLELQRPDKRKYKCPHCSRVLEGKESLVQHISDHAGNVTNNVPIPLKNYVDGESSIQSCTHCHLVLEGKKQSSIDRHLQMHTSPAIQCPYCKMTYKGTAGGKYNLDRHIRMKHTVQKVPWAERVALARLRAEAALAGKLERVQTPIATQKSPNPKPLAQNETESPEPEVTVSRGSLQKIWVLEEHESLSVTELYDDRPFLCPVLDCRTEYRAKNLAQLKKHIKDVHPSYEFPIFKCPHCEKELRSQTKLDSHIKSAHTTVTCAVCDKTFHGLSKLKVHKISAHPEPEKMVACNICGKVWRNDYLLKKHLETHDSNYRRGREKFLCDLCGKAYHEKRRLNLHVRVVHSRIRFSCPEPGCGKTFSRKYFLRTHFEATHDPTAPGYPCPICGKIFKKKDYLSQHLTSKVHGGPGLHRTKQKVKQMEAQCNISD